MILLDSNVILYFLAGKLAAALPTTGVAISCISQIELFSYPSLSPEEEKSLHTFFSSTEFVGVDQAVTTQAAAIRRLTKLKVPDSIVAATAITREYELWTHDKQFSTVPGLRVSAPLIQP